MKIHDYIFVFGRKRRNPYGGSGVYGFILITSNGYIYTNLLTAPKIIINIMNTSLFYVACHIWMTICIALFVEIVCCYECDERKKEVKKLLLQ